MPPKRTSRGPAKIGDAAEKDEASRNKAPPKRIPNRTAEAEEAVKKTGSSTTKVSLSGWLGVDVSKNKDQKVDALKVSGITCERYGEADDLGLIFTHGAGGGITNAATVEFCTGFAKQGAPVICFQGGMNLASRTKSFHTISKDRERPIAFGGRSMGARAAVIAAKEDKSIKAVILVSYPLVGAQKKDVRDQILLELSDDVDVLFISGSKDSMCDLEQLREVMNRMKARSWLLEAKGCDHGMSVSPKAGAKPLREATGAAAAQWLQERDHNVDYCTISWENGQVAESAWSESENAKRSTDSKKRKRDD